MALPKTVLHDEPKRRAKVIKLPQQQMAMRVTWQVGAEPGSPEAIAAAERMIALGRRLKVGRKDGASAVIKAVRQGR